MATFCYASFTTIANVLPSDLYHRDSVACVSGLSGTGAGIGTIVAFKLIGYFSDARQAGRTHVFEPIMIFAGLVPFVGMILCYCWSATPRQQTKAWCVGSEPFASRQHQRRKFPMLNCLPSGRKPSDTRVQVAQSTAEEKCEQLGNKNQSEDVLVQLRSLDCRRISLR
jgi:hypothetical protein